TLCAGLGDYQKAYNYHQSHITYRDKLRDRRAQQKALESHYQYAWLRREQSWREELLRQEIQQEAERRRWQIGLVVLALGLVGAGGVMLLLLRFNRQLQTQKATIRAQKQALEESYFQIAEQHENLQSQLRYARRIQKGLMASPSLPFPNALWYQPCQEVGGDFYWSHLAKEGHVLLGLGDCTGHGVAGSFMTILSYILLEQAVREGQIYPLPLVRYLHKAWMQSFQAGEEELQDGLQGTFLSIDAKARKIEAVPAGQYFWVVYPEGKVEEIAPTLPGVFRGTPEDPSLWQTWSRDIPPEGLRIALASDGLTAQIGGSSRKKWGRKQWRTFLSETAQLPPTQALSLLQERWHAYRHPFAMVDDVTVWIIDLPPLSNQIS
ncbi:MAG: SpoIIE family protein phosphatase, partial [Bacteroidia bacterium]|nr:SpoIIE family protein phosphatase [Bacteroidia bacterium]